jgi:ABC-type molybdate transport system substrate-binding protein
MVSGSRATQAARAQLSSPVLRLESESLFGNSMHVAILVVKAAACGVLAMEALKKVILEKKKKKKKKQTYDANPLVAVSAVSGKLSRLALTFDLR